MEKLFDHLSVFLNLDSWYLSKDGTTFQFKADLNVKKDFDEPIKMFNAVDFGKKMMKFGLEIDKIV